MKMRKILAAMLALALILGTVGALAEEWTCPVCEQEGNTGNYCSYCGTAKPAADWTCSACGQEGNTGNFCPNCGAAKPAANIGLLSPAEPEEEENDSLEQIPGETGRVKVNPVRIDASSFISNKQDPYRWEPYRAFDGIEGTCWQVSAKKGLKEKCWIDFEFEPDQIVDELWFKNGFWSNTDVDQYSINSRPKEIRAEFLYAGGTGFTDTIQIDLEDEWARGWQQFAIGRHTNVKIIRIYIWSIYKGSRYTNDVCLAEIMPVLYHSAEGVQPPQETGEAPVYESHSEVSAAKLLMKLATRSGPGTEYDEPGTFFGKNWKTTTVRVLGKHWDGSIWWVLVDFSNGGKADYRVWTGLKRVDVDLSRVQEVYAIGQGTVNGTSETYRGPGGNYAKAKVTIAGWKDVVAYGRENGYVEVEFEQKGKWYRLWVPEYETSIDWGNNFSGEG